MKKEINIDYLAQMRELREKDVDYKHKNNERTLDQLMNDNRLNEYEKMDAIKRRAEKMERQAKMQERLMKVAQAANFPDY